VLDERRRTVPCGDHADTVAERYRLGPVLRRSSGCCAHRAHDDLLQRTVRVTLVATDPATAGSFTLRPQGWLDRDPEVAELYDAGSDHGRLFLVTHLPDEPTLAESTPPGGLDLGQLRELGTSVATALLPRHRRGAVHGGLAAGTVALTPQGTSLADFGLLPWLARWGDVPVAPPYVAPEQRTGGESGPASDVYALGRLLAELAPEHGLRPRLRALIADMTAESPSARPSMEEVAERLARLGGRRAPSGRGASVRRRAGLVAAACCLVGLGVGLSAFTGGGSGSDAAGATLAATAAAPVPVLPLGPLLPVTGSGTSGHTVSAATASAATASAATASATTASATTASVTTASARSASSRAAVAASDGSPRVVEAAQRTSTGTHDQGGSDSSERPSRAATTGTDNDTSGTPARSGQHGTGRSGDDATQSGHPLRGIVEPVAASWGHHPRSGSGKDGGDADDGAGKTGDRGGSGRATSSGDADGPDRGSDAS
jgi:serine/threonine protein kinase